MKNLDFRSGLIVGFVVGTLFGIAYELLVVITQLRHIIVLLEAAK